MSELKARHIVDVYDSYYAEKPFGERSQVYLKSEADKVIAEKNEEIARLRDSIDKLLKTNTEQIIREVMRKTLIYGAGFVPVEHAMKIVVELRNNKYKRCLAMARIAQDDWHLHNSFYAMGHREFEKRKCEFYEKWIKRWLELAEQFKEAK